MPHNMIIILYFRLPYFHVSSQIMLYIPHSTLLQQATGIGTRQQLEQWPEY